MPDAIPIPDADANPVADAAAVAAANSDSDNAAVADAVDTADPDRSRFAAANPVADAAAVANSDSDSDNAAVADAVDSADPDRSRFAAGDLVLFIDRKGRSYQHTLAAGRSFHSHLGALPGDAVIGQPVGGWYATNRGHILLGIRPTLGDYVRLMPRGPQVIYAKDLGNIVSMADLFPGAVVVEAGFGSGALTAALLRAVGPAGRVHSYEINPDAIPKAMANVQSVIPDTANLEVIAGSIFDGISATAIDRVILDLPEPWRALDAAASALITGGILLSFLPTILQVQELALALHDHGSFARIETAETLLRGWNVTRRSVRPAHRMVAHSGFITTAVRCLEPARQGYARSP